MYIMYIMYIIANGAGGERRLRQGVRRGPR